MSQNNNIHFPGISGMADRCMLISQPVTVLGLYLDSVRLNVFTEQIMPTILHKQNTIPIRK